jgi:putative acetyltransferase
MHIAHADLDAPEVEELVRLHLDGMGDASPPESIHALGLAGLRSPEVTVWSASEGGQVLGIGALRVEPGASEGEIKSMRTDPKHLGRGVGRGILRAIIDDATARGLHRLSLETGATEPFSPAHRLYLSEGFEPCGPFGSYGEDPFSRYFTLSLPR